MIENNPESAAGSCQETGAGGHAGNSDAPRERVEYGAPDTSARKPGAPIDAEADACDCATCREGLPSPAGMVRGALDALATAAAAKTLVKGRSTLEILADHWPSVRPGS